MKLFTVGPVDMYEETLKIGGEPIPYFRTDEFSEIMFQIEKDYLGLLKAPVGSKLITLTASGTGAMEAAVINTLTSEDKVLIVALGSFGKRFSQICDCHNINHTDIILPFGQVLTEEIIKEYDDKGYTALLVNIHETSIGQLFDYRMLGDFCKRNNMYYILDGISSFLADELNMEEAGINIIITASQKAMALPPGLSFIAADQKIINERINKIDSKSIYFDFKDYLKNMERGQTPFTPAVGIVMQLKERVSSLAAKGVEEEIAHHKQLAESFRTMCEEEGIMVAKYPKSNALTPLIFPEGNALIVFRTMKDQYDTMLTPSGGDISGNILRVGHLGNETIEDLQRLIKNIKEVL